MTGMLFGRSPGPGSFVWMLRTGSASTTSTQVAASAETSGWRRTGRRAASQIRERESSPFSRCRMVRRSRTRASSRESTRTRRPSRYSAAAKTPTTPRSIRSPSFPSSAGRTVSDPIMALATTTIDAMPSDVKIAEPEISIPAIAISTVAPDTSTASPEVAPARDTASRPERPARRSSRSRLT